MGFDNFTGTLIGKSPLPRANVKQPDLIARWIVAVMPCLKAPAVQSQADTNAVIRYLRGCGVTDDIIAQALSLTGYKFSFDSDATRILWERRNRNDDVYVPPPNGSPPPPTMQEVSESDVRSGTIYTAQVLEQKYRVAMAAHNPRLMIAILKALIDLLGGAGSAFQKTEQKRQEMEKVREEILRNAPTARRALTIGGGGQGPPRGGGRVQHIGDNTYVVIDEEEVEEQAAEGEGEGEREAD